MAMRKNVIIVLMMAIGTYYPNRSMNHRDEIKFLSGVFHAPNDDNGNNPDRSICHREHTGYCYLCQFRKNYIPYQRLA
jgi:hypothetical protein